MKFLRVLCVVISLACCTSLFAQGEFAVQIAAYETPVSDGYFQKLPNEQITYYKDHQRIYHYFIGPKFSTESEAKATFATAKAAYPNSIILDLKKLKECAACCNPDGNRVLEGSLGKFVDIPKPTYTPPPSQPMPTVVKVNECNLPAFDLRNQQDFEKVRSVLEANPGSQALIRSCGKSQQLSCYLSMRNSAYCGIPILSNAEMRSILKCDNLNACVYVVDVNNDVINIEEAFRRTIGN